MPHTCQARHPRVKFERGPRSAAGPEALVRAAADGDQQAWNELVHMFEGLLATVARAHRLNDADAADVTQTTWLRLVQHLPTLRDPAHVGAWLATTARRECLALLRSQAREMPTDQLPDVADDRAPGLDAHVCALEERAAVSAALTGLRRRDQQLLTMLMFDPQPSYDSISAHLAMPVGSIGPTRARALRRLQDGLTPPLPARLAA